MKVQRILPTEESADLLGLVREIAAGELAPRVADFEAAHEFPREIVRTLGKAGLLSLPYPEEYGGGGQPYEVYLQALEEIAYHWFAVAEAVNVHNLACFGTATYGTRAQREELLPDMLGGELLGAYCLSEAEAGSDVASLSTQVVREEDGYRITGTKSWVTHAGHADFYNVFGRTGGPGARGLSCLVVPGSAPGLVVHAKERKLGVWSSPTAQVGFEDVRVPAQRLIGREGKGFLIAMGALDCGRLGIAACAVGIAQAAADYAVRYAKERRQFGQRVISFQGVGFMLADMATQIAAARALTLAAARLKDTGRPYSLEAAKAKLFATDMAMKVTTDAVQVLGGAGYVADHPVERWMREAKLLQIVEGTNQIQRMVISQGLG
ncbi:acyl-CoA dehydrogenase family protein [Actinoplanes regularis]|uniref:acyl-CoA dehydrogenase family protein n=1 Tax=Actinoplanes regularis TaxID=52697 RepID=UPI0024A24167|nr:acyl-CoA dehydrogenase family protein [Actinoplanes regularis]GLW34243.1 acyl-CoA dehydrogenase [Actinoplanes regularis]